MAGVISDAATLDMRALRRHRRLRAERAGDHRARRHAAGRDREACSPSAASACRSSRRASPTPTAALAGTVGGMVAAGLAGPGARGRRRRARLRAGRAAAQRPRRPDALRRPGDEERRRLRRVAPARRLVGHARRDLRGVAEGAADARGRRRRCASTCARPRRSSSLHAWAGQPLPLNASVWWRDTLAVRLRGANAAVAAARAQHGRRGRSPTTLGDAFWEGLRDQRDEFFVEARARGRAREQRAVAPVAAADHAGAAVVRRHADRMGRRAALDRRRRRRTTLVLRPRRARRRQRVPRQRRRRRRRGATRRRWRRALLRASTSGCENRSIRTASSIPAARCASRDPTACRPSSLPNSPARPTASRPRPSCASACTAASAPPPARPTSCSATSSTARAAAST